MYGREEMVVARKKQFTIGNLLDIMGGGGGYRKLGQGYGVTLGLWWKGVEAGLHDREGKKSHGWEGGHPILLVLRHMGG